MKTLNQIVAEVESWASSHLQVHSFGQGDIWEISPSSSKFTFPLMWVTVGASDPREMEMVDQFNVLVCDLVDTGERNELDVLSDTRQILRDLVAWYRQQHSAAYIVEFQGSITPFTERFAERVSGHALTIRLRQPYDYDSCEIPLGTPLPAPPFCEPATFTLINTASPPDTLDSGSISSGGSEVIVAPAVTVLRDGLPFAVVPSSQTVDVPSDCPPPPPCADATVNLNSTFMVNVPSGGTENIQVRQSSGSTQVGSKQGQHWRIGDSEIEINGTQVAAVKAEDGLDIPVIQDGNPVGAFDPNTNSWVIPPCGAGGSVAVTVSNATPDFGDIITITSTPTGFTPTSYLYLAFDGARMIPISTVNPDDNITTWRVSLFGIFAIYAIATDGTTRAWGVIDVTVDSDPDADAYITAAGITDTDQILVTNMLVTGWKSIGIWNTTLAMYPIMGGTASSHKINLKNPADSDAAFRLTIFGGWTHDAMGMLGNGSNTYANTHLIPSAHLTSNNNAVMLYVNQGASESKYDFSTTSDSGGANNGFGLITQYLVAGNTAFYITNAFVSAVVGNPLGMTMGFTDSGTKRMYRNASQIAAAATASSSLSNFPMYLGANNGGGTLGFIAAKRYCFAAVFSAGMTEAQAIDAYNLVQACQVILGRQA